MCNLGEQTLLWYEAWGVGDIRLATWPGDRFGYFEVFSIAGHCISRPICVDGSARVYANVGGVSEHSSLTVELLDAQFRPLPGYCGEDCVPLRVAGLRQPVVWRDKDVIRGIDGAFRLKVSFGGLRPEDAKLYALYVTEAV